MKKDWQNATSAIPKSISNIGKLLYIENKEKKPNPNNTDIHAVENKYKR